MLQNRIKVNNKVYHNFDNDKNVPLRAQSAYDGVKEVPIIKPCVWCILQLSVEHAHVHRVVLIQ